MVSTYKWVFPQSAVRIFALKSLIMALLQSSTHYFWSQGDLLGQGASGAVYKARHKKTGELFAVKTFNRICPQKREFEVMQKIKHENIVRLLAIEEESVTRVKVLIMELCSGGSLLNLLDEPANSFGFEEREFFTVLYDVASGLQYLRESGIVHRDIKPGNILLYKSEDGRHIYKLTDFGAARELEDEEQFLSLYGTEEYLYPDMYARAVLRQQGNRMFGASVDLWSLGVTLYHTATGRLPFRPYGGRNNKEVMYQMTTRKESGVISGVQYKPNGPVEYSRDLPKTCQLSDGAKLLVTPMLAGLMESNQDKMWTFNQFFDEVKHIKTRRLIHVFDSISGKSLHIFLKPDDRLAQLHDAIARQTDLSADRQQLILDGRNISERLSPMTSARAYPPTSDNEPFYLFLKVNSLDQLPVTGELTKPVLPSVQNSDMSGKAINLAADYSEVKTITKNLFLIKQCVMNFHHCQDHLLLAAKVFLFRLSAAIMRVQAFSRQFSNLLKETGKRIHCLSVQHNRNHALFTKLEEQNRAVASSVKQYGMEREREIDRIKKEFQDLSESVKEPLDRIKHLYKEVIEQNKFDWQDITNYSCQNQLVCLRKIEVLYDEVEKTMCQFRLDKRNRSLPKHQEQIHRFERMKAVTIYEKAVRILRSGCQNTTEVLFKQFYRWFRCSFEANQMLDVYEVHLSKMTVSQEELSKSLDVCQPQLLGRLEHVQGQLKSIEDDYETFNAEEFSMIKRADLIPNSDQILEERMSLLNKIKKEIQDIEHQVQENSEFLKQLQNLP